jgi:hypothetical protein
MGFAWLVRLFCPHQEQQQTHFLLDEHIGLIDNKPPEVKSYVCVGMVLSVRFSKWISSNPLISFFLSSDNRFVFSHFF